MNGNASEPVGDESQAARLTAYALGQLDGAEKAAVERFLAASSESQKDVRATELLAGQVRLAARADSLQPSPEIRESVERRLIETERIASASAEPSLAVSDWRRRFERRIAVGAAIAASLLVLLSAFALSRRPGDDNIARDDRPAAAPGENSPERGLAVAPLPDELRPRDQDALAPPIFDSTASHGRWVASPGPSREDKNGWRPSLAESPLEPNAPNQPESPDNPATAAPSSAIAVNGPTPSGLGPPSANPEFKEGDAWDRSPNKRPVVRQDPAAPNLRPERFPARPWVWRGPVETSRWAIASVPAERPELSEAAEAAAEPAYENPFLAVAEHPLSSFSIQADSDGYIAIRQMLRQGRLPPPGMVHIEDLVNGFAYEYPQPKPGEAFAVSFEVAQCPWAKQHRLVRIGIRGRAASAHSVRPVPAASDLRAYVEFNPAEVENYRLIGYEFDLAQADPKREARQAGGDLGPGRTATILYEVIPCPWKLSSLDDPPLRYQRRVNRELTDAARSGELLTVRIQYRKPGESQFRVFEGAVKDAEKSFDRTSDDFRWAAAVASFGMLLRNSAYRGNTTYQSVEDAARAAAGPDPTGEREAFLQLVQSAAKLAADRP